MWRYASVKHGEKMKNDFLFVGMGGASESCLETLCALFIHTGTLVLHIGILALALEQIFL